MATIKRCSWCGDDPEYVAYHDTEWGVPVYDDQKNFELLILEGAQAGLSWLTILRKREGYRKAFADFDPVKVARFTEKKIQQVLLQSGGLDSSTVHALFIDRPEFVAVARNPFSAALIRLYAERHNGKLPPRRMDLFEDELRARLNDDAVAPRLVSAGLDADGVLTFCREIARKMYEKGEAGLEISLAELEELMPACPVRAVAMLLRYARLARLDSDTEQFSFVHRRFAEYFIADGLDAESVLAKRDSIPTDSRWRDALVLYCEVAEEQDARAIANYCWTEIQYKLDSPDHASRSSAMHALRFLTDAFQARRAMISDFADDLAELLNLQVWSGSILNAKLAVEATGVLSDEGLSKVVSSEILFKRRDIVMRAALRSCRKLPVLSDEIEFNFRCFLWDMDLVQFWQERRELRFSLGLSESFRGLQAFCVARTRDIWLSGLALLTLAALERGMRFSMFLAAAAGLMFSVVFGFMNTTQLHRLLRAVACMVAVPTMIVEFGSPGWAGTGGFLPVIVFILLPIHPVAFWWKRVRMEVLSDEHHRAALKSIVVVTCLISSPFVLGWLGSGFLLRIPPFLPWLMVVLLAAAWSGVFGAAVWKRIRSERLYSQLRKAPPRTRVKIGEAFGSLSSPAVRVKYVAFLRDAGVSPSGQWEDGLPNISDDRASQMLAELEEKWLKLDRR